MKNLLFALACLWSSVSLAGTVTASGRTFEVADSSCAAVRAAVQKLEGGATSYSVGCSSDPVVVGSTLSWIWWSSPTSLNAVVWSVTAVNAAPPPSYQPQIDAHTSRITAVENSILTINSKLAASPLTGRTLTDSEYAQFSAVMTAANTPYDYQAGGSIFAAVLIATLSLYLMVRAAMEVVRIVRSARRI